MSRQLYIYLVLSQFAFSDTLSPGYGELGKTPAPKQRDLFAKKTRIYGIALQIASEENLQRWPDSGRDAWFNIPEHPHVDHGDAVTSLSSQGATADREPVHVDTEQAHDQLVNSRVADVSVSRGRYDAQIYTIDAGKLAEELGGDLSKQSALETVRGKRLRTAVSARTPRAGGQCG